MVIEQRVVGLTVYNDMIIIIVAQCLACVCVHDGLCFQYTALRNHRSVPKQATSYATRQTVCTFVSGHLKCTVWMYPTGASMDMHGSLVLYVLCDGM